MKQMNRWQIECSHTPETIDRILLPLRKRGLSIESLSYVKQNEQQAICTIEFQLENSEIERVYKNMMRIYDIHAVKKIG